VIRISNFQLYCILVVFLIPLAFLEIPEILAGIVQQNAWMPAFFPIIPGYGLVLMYNYILQNSQQPFPDLLTEHMGKPLGWVLGLMYAVFFIFLTSFSLRLFTDFIETNVLPGTPISIHIGVLILAMAIGIKSGIGNLARLQEITVIIGLVFSSILMGIIIFQQGSWERLLPVGYLDYKALALASGNSTVIIGRLFIVLTFGFWCQDKSAVRSIMTKAMATYVLVIGVTTLAVIMTFGGIITPILTFPTFSMITLINIADFIQNIDIIFIGIWIMGVYGVGVISWFMACYSLQLIFNLHDYRFIATGSSLIIGILSILISANIMELLLITGTIVPAAESLFFLFIPLIIAVIIRIKASIARREDKERAA